jgi:hypothetical protein
MTNIMEFNPNFTYPRTVYILWHVDLLLGNDRETNNYSAAIAK